MSADWFYLKTGFFRTHKTVGPLSEPDLLSKISKGEIRPDTMLSSSTKTHGHSCRDGSLGKNASTKSYASLKRDLEQNRCFLKHFI